MLRIEVSLPAEFANDFKFETELDGLDHSGPYDVVLALMVKVCAWCGAPFVPCREVHRFCKDPNCRKTASRKRDREYEPETGG